MIVLPIWDFGRCADAGPGERLGTAVGVSAFFPPDTAGSAGRPGGPAGWGNRGPCPPPIFPDKRGHALRPRRLDGLTAAPNPTATRGAENVPPIFPKRPPFPLPC